MTLIYNANVHVCVYSLVWPTYPARWAVVVLTTSTKLIISGVSHPSGHTQTCPHIPCTLILDILGQCDISVKKLMGLRLWPRTWNFIIKTLEARIPEYSLVAFTPMALQFYICVVAWWRRLRTRRVLLMQKPELVTPLPSGGLWGLCVETD